MAKFRKIRTARTPEIQTDEEWAGLQSLKDFARGTSLEGFPRESDAETETDEEWGVPRAMLEGFLRESAEGWALSVWTNLENELNGRRLADLRKRWSHELIALILDEYFEYGFNTRADLMVRSQMEKNAMATKDWLNALFLEHFSEIPILLGILRIIARFDYYEVYPEGPTMAVAALTHKDAQVKECGIRAFESWGTLDSLDVLENLGIRPAWLQDYVDQVVKDLREEHHVVDDAKHRQLPG